MPEVSVKEWVRELIERLPDDCSFEDVQYELYVREAIESGLRDIDAGRSVPHEEALKRMGIARE